MTAANNGKTVLGIEIFMRSSFKVKLKRVARKFHSDLRIDILQWDMIVHDIVWHCLLRRTMGPKVGMNVSVYARSVKHGDLFENAGSVDEYDASSFGRAVALLMERIEALEREHVALSKA